MLSLLTPYPVCLFTETRFGSVAQDKLELTILLSHIPKHWVTGMQHHAQPGINVIFSQKRAHLLKGVKYLPPVPKATLTVNSLPSPSLEELWGWEL